MISGRKKRAIVTTKHQRSYFFPLWERYYADLFDYVQVIPIKYIDHNLMPGAKMQHLLVNDAVPRLLKEYDLVVTVDVDEFLVPNPDKYTGLLDYLDNFSMDAACCVGYHVMQMDKDKPFDLDIPITDQRNYWTRDDNYDKPVITTRPLKYTMGLHKASPPVEQDVDLVMLHLRDADIYRSLARFGNQDDPGAWEAFRSRQEKAVKIPKKWRVV